MSAVCHVRKQRKLRQNVTSFAALIATPETDTVVLPAGARLSIPYPDETDPELLLATAVGAFTSAEDRTPADRELKTRPLTEAEIDDEIETLSAGRLVIDWLEKGVEVTLESGFELYVDIGLGRWRKIAEGA